MTSPLLRGLLAVLGLVLALAPAHAAGGKAKNKRPNIIYIMADDHASAAIGAYGSWLKDVVKTPNIDKLAKDGMRFTNCVVTNSICTPSRAVMLTGLYSHKNGVLTLSDQIDVNRRHLGHLLRVAGYQTAMIGKWHLGKDPEHIPAARGFEREFSMLAAAGSHFDMTGNNDEVPDNQYTEDGRYLTKLPKGFYSTRTYTDKMIEYIGRMLRTASRSSLTLRIRRRTSRSRFPIPGCGATAANSTAGGMSFDRRVLSA